MIKILFPFDHSFMQVESPVPESELIDSLLEYLPKEWISTELKGPSQLLVKFEEGTFPEEVSSLILGNSKHEVIESFPCNHYQVLDDSNFRFSWDFQKTHIVISSYSQYKESIPYKVEIKTSN